MKDPTTEPLTLNIDAGIAHLSMRGKTVTVKSHHSFYLAGPNGGEITLTSETEVGSVSWPVRPKEAGQIWNKIFKEVPDARN